MNSVTSAQRALYSLPVAFCLCACGSGKTVGDALRPSAPSVNEARGTSSVYAVQDRAQPLVVDWQPEARADLEVAMRQGVAVVASEPTGLRILNACRIDGNYAFIGISTKEQVIRLASEDEVKANLAGGGLGILPKIGVELGRTLALDVAIVIVGKQMTTWVDASRENLSGECAGATHFVRGATVGAFAMQSSTSGKVSSAAEIFATSLDGHSASEKFVHQTDGNPSDCRAATTQGTVPPPGCGALIRVELMRIHTTPTKPATNPTAGHQTTTAPSSTEACPEGFVSDGSRCTRAQRALAYTCKGDRVDDCKTQCDKGSAESCDLFASALYNGQAAEERTRAVELFHRACDGGLAASCYHYAGAIFIDERVSNRVQVARQYWDRACADGYAVACAAIADTYWTDNDYAPAVKYADLGCRGGDMTACSRLGTQLLAALGVGKDEPRAAALFKRACDGGDIVGCNNYAYMAEFGRGVAHDETAAVRGYQRACQLSPSACVWRGVMLHAGIGGTKDPVRAREQFSKSCDEGVKHSFANSSGEALACSALRELYGVRVDIDPAALSYFAKVFVTSCDSDVERDCTQAGLLLRSLGDAPRAEQAIDKGCVRGDKWACEIRRQLKLK